MEIPDEVLRAVTEKAIQKHPGSICITNYKGGVGKTTVTCLLGYYLAKNHDVLLIDIDPQCSLSLAVGVEIHKVDKTDFTIHNLVSPSKWSHVKKTRFYDYVVDVPDIHAPKGLRIIRGSFDVDDLDLSIAKEFAENKREFHELALYCRQLLNALDQYDYILVDCPPNKMFLTQAMLRACSYYLTVTIPDIISIYGMPRLLRWVNQIEESQKPLFLGCVLNAVVRAGGNPLGTVNQQNARVELLNRIKENIKPAEVEVVKDKPILASIPRLDIISLFLGQGSNKTAWYDFQRSKSGQASVDSVMVNLVSRLQERQKEYAKA